MSKTKDWLMDMEENFWSEANEEIGGCECVSEFVDTMMKSPNVGGAFALSSAEELESELNDCWNDFWSNYM